jgi:glycerol-3-phosphate dehydrogenase subunit B
VRESLLDLPVYQPGDRSLWHRRDFLHPAGHPLNLAGLRVDNRFRPADAVGKAVYPAVFAAGSVLAHQDWIRQKCGSGLAIATAYGAVDGYCRTRT